RSTRRYCSDRCRVAAARERSRPRARKGLLPAQVRILEVLAEMSRRGGYCIDRRQNAERAGGGGGDMSGPPGRGRPARRETAGARGTRGRPSPPPRGRAAEGGGATGPPPLAAMPSRTAGRTDAVDGPGSLTAQNAMPGFLQVKKLRPAEPVRGVQVGRAGP